MIKNLPTMRETRVQSLIWKDPLEKRMAALQYSCLENPMDKGTWWAAVHGGGHKELDMIERACAHACACTHTHTHTHALADFSSSHQSVSKGWAQPQGISARAGPSTSKRPAAPHTKYPHRRHNVIPHEP